MFKGALILESLRVGTNLSNLNLTARQIYRFRREDATADQPDTWSVIELEIHDADAAGVAQALSKALASGWYVDFRSDTEVFVAFAGRVFRYARGDQVGRAEAQAHGRSAGVPNSQLDWPA